MSLYTLIIVTFVIFMAINVIIGLRGRKHASTTKDFLTASGQSGIWFIIASAVGASIGSGVVIGTTQYAVKLGVAGAWYAIACGLACVVHAFVMTRFIYRNKLVSFSDYFKRRYDSNFIILLYSGIGPLPALHPWAVSWLLQRPFSRRSALTRRSDLLLQRQLCWSTRCLQAFGVPTQRRYFRSA